MSQQNTFESQIKDRLSKLINREDQIDAQTCLKSLEAPTENLELPISLPKESLRS